MMPQASLPPGAQDTQVDRALAWAIVAIALFAYLAMAIPSVWSARLGVSQFQDDAFYYLVPARHFVEQGRFTFDGVHPTNGFHPLWMAAAVALTAIAGPAALPEHHVFALNLLEKLVQGAALAACIAFFLRTRRDAAAAGTGYLGIAILLLCPYYVIFDQGMETTLAVFMLILAINALLDDAPVRLGIVLVALFLCRLDTGLFVGLPMALWLGFCRPDLPRRWWAVAPLTASMLGVSLAYLALTGHTVPISGAVKSSFPSITWHGSYFVEPLNVAALYGWRTLLHGLNIWLCGGLLLGGCALVAAGELRPKARNATFVIAFVGGLLLANLLLFQKWEKSVDPRYYALPMAVASFVMGAGVEALFARVAGGRRTPWQHIAATLPGVIAVAALALEALVFASRFDHSLHSRSDPVQALFKDLDAVLPRDAVLAGTDVGALSFWTGRRVINLDGVMNDYAYQEWVRDRRLAEYLRRNGATHVATALWDSEQTYTARPTEPMYRHQVDPDATHARPYRCHNFYVHSYVFRTDSDAICLDARSEVFRRPVGRIGIGEAAYVVYALPPETR